ncbi:copper chaperone PCu(A)C [Qipengyuania sp. 1NDH17]|uniref:Copper chaperone PCu(A)C n=1 Tax=Qipengyuania polymorpha TaxID=2867234 RepID=A0ABS7IYF5_9SPHN|nr:copper chaperone PCu(A)C [Qipengyuania polymorpha]MBX7457350.1 copper chaperone PCu(A)C [Qipengyuania polymorpha]
MNFGRRLLALPAIAALALAACADREEAEETTVAATDAAPVVENARLVLPPVSGNPAAAYFDITNPGEKPLTISAVGIDGAGRSELHQSMEMDGKMMMEGMSGIDIAAGGTGSLAPGGMHVMAFDLDDSVTAGSTVEMTLTFADGETLTTQVTVQGAGDER